MNDFKYAEVIAQVQAKLAQWMLQHGEPPKSVALGKSQMRELRQWLAFSRPYPHYGPTFICGIHFTEAEDEDIIKLS